MLQKWGSKGSGEHMTTSAVLSTLHLNGPWELEHLKIVRHKTGGKYNTGEVKTFVRPCVLSMTYKFAKGTTPKDA